MQTSAAQSLPADDFDLDDLLAESLDLRADAAKLKDGRKTLKNKNALSGTELSELQADVARLEAAREWLPRADVVMFTIQTCQTCGNVAGVFTGFFQRQSHRSMRQLDRWVAAPECNSLGLKKEIKNTEVFTPVCPCCIADFGYPVEQLGVEFYEEAVGEAAPAEDSSELIGKLQVQIAEYEALIDELMTDAETARALQAAAS